MIRALAVASFAIASVASAADYQRVLLPVYTIGQVLPGANGSLWSTELAVENRTSTDILIGPCAAGFPIPDSLACLPDPLTIPAHAVGRDPQVSHTPSGLRGEFVYLLTRDLANLQLELTLSQRGVAVARLPVVREADYSTGTLSMLDVSVSPGSRALVRIYGLDNRPATARVQMFKMETSGTKVFDGRITLVRSPYDIPDFPLAPSYAEVPLDGYVREGESVRITISEIEGDRLWAFATVTSATGETVVVITPAAY